MKEQVTVHGWSFDLGADVSAHVVSFVIPNPNDSYHSITDATIDQANHVRGDAHKENRGAAIFLCELPISCGSNFLPT